MASVKEVGEIVLRIAGTVEQVVPLGLATIGAIGRILEIVAPRPDPVTGIAPSREEVMAAINRALAPWAAVEQTAAGELAGEAPAPSEW